MHRLTILSSLKDLANQGCLAFIDSPTATNPIALSIKLAFEVLAEGGGGNHVAPFQLTDHAATNSVLEAANFSLGNGTLET